MQKSILIVNDDQLQIEGYTSTYHTGRLLNNSLKLDLFDKILFVDLEYDDKVFKRCVHYKLQDKMYLIMMESELIKPHQYSKKVHAHFKKIFTWDDTLVDGKKYIKYHWPYQFNLNYPLKSDRLFTCMVNANKIAIREGELYSKRKKTALVFRKGIDVYGWGWNRLQLRPIVFIHAIKNLRHFNLSRILWWFSYAFNLRKIKNYKGMTNDLIDTLSNYKFCICYENYIAPGYITEKIFNCFTARCIPVYLGAPNITDYIPKETFIDRRDFSSDEALFIFLSSLPDETYQAYLHNIEVFLSANNQFSEEHFKKLIKKSVDEC